MELDSYQRRRPGDSRATREETDILRETQRIYPSRNELTAAEAPRIPTALLEYQLYAGGLQVFVIPQGPRPEGLPTATSVGPQSGEIALKPGEYAVEFSRFRTAAGRLTWIGCFAFATDSVYGDRGNSCGIGAWLIEAFPRYSNYLIAGLRDLCDLLAKEGNSAKFIAASILFQKSHIGEYIAPLDDLVEPMRGVDFNNGEFPRTDYFTAPLTDGETFFEQVSWSILKFSIAAGCQSAQPRQLYILAHAPPRHIHDTEVAVLPDAQRSIGQIVRSFPLVLANLNKDSAEQLKVENSLKAALHDSRQEQEELQHKQRQLREELNKSLQNVQSLGERVTALKSELAQSRKPDSRIEELTTQVRQLNAHLEQSISVPADLKQIGQDVKQLQGRLPDARWYGDLFARINSLATDPPHPSLPDTEEENPEEPTPTLSFWESVYHKLRSPGKAKGDQSTADASGPVVWGIVGIAASVVLALLLTLKMAEGWHGKEARPSTGGMPAQAPPAPALDLAPPADTASPGTNAQADNASDPPPAPTYNDALRQVAEKIGSDAIIVRASQIDHSHCRNRNVPDEPGLFWADFNADGQLDFATFTRLNSANSSHADYSLDIFLNRGHGDFTRVPIQRYEALPNASLTAAYIQPAMDDTGSGVELVFVDCRKGEVGYRWSGGQKFVPASY